MLFMDSFTAHIVEDVLKSLDDKTEFDPKNAGCINCKNCMSTCGDAISK